MNAFIRQRSWMVIRNRFRLCQMNREFLYVTGKRAAKICPRRTITVRWRRETMFVETSSEMCVDEGTDVSSLILGETVAVTVRGLGGPSSRTRWSSATIFKTTDVTDLSAGSSTAPRMWRQSLTSQVGSPSLMTLLMMSLVTLQGICPPPSGIRWSTRGWLWTSPPPRGASPSAKIISRYEALSIMVKH